MHNMVYLIGRLTQDIEIVEMEDGVKRGKLVLAVQRPYKNFDGIYETDFIDCILWNAVAENTAEYCKKGDLVGIKGRIQTRCYETEDGEKKKITEIIVDKLSF